MTAGQAQATSVPTPTGPTGPAAPTGPASPAATPTPTAGNTMTGATQKDLGTELGKLRASNNSGPMDRSVSVLGVLLAIVGLVVILICFMQSRAYSNILDQMDALILSLFGIGLVIVGSTLYIRSAMTRFLRYWLLRMVYEQRDLARQSAQAPTPLDD
jgi:hypothetical protein